MTTLSSIITPTNLVTLTGAATLTNKTLTAPVLASANITTALTLTGAAGTSGQVLTSAGGGAPTWETAASTPEIITPTNTSPANAATAVVETPTLTGSAYFSLYSSAQSAIQVQVNTSADFTSPLYSSGDQAAGVSFTDRKSVV